MAPIAVLKGVDFEATEGQTIALCGPSGCGKSTLLHLFGGLDFSDRGRISVNGVEVNRHRNLLRLLRHEIGFVFQLHNLIPDLTLEENCLIPTVAAGIDRGAARERLHQLAERTGLTNRLGQRIQKLSGGERQRLLHRQHVHRRIAPGVALVHQRPSGILHPPQWPLPHVPS